MDAEKMADDILPGDFLPGGLTRASLAKVKRAIATALRTARREGLEDAAQVAIGFADEHEKWRGMFDSPKVQALGDSLARLSHNIATAIRAKAKEG